MRPRYVLRAVAMVALVYLLGSKTPAPEWVVLPVAVLVGVLVLAASVAVAARRLKPVEREP